MIEYDQLVIIELHFFFYFGDSGRKAFADALETNIAITNIKR